MMYAGRDVTVHQLSDDWVMIDQLPLEDGEPGFKGKIISPTGLREVTQSDVDAMKEHQHVGFFWSYFAYDDENERFVVRR